MYDLHHSPSPRAKLTKLHRYDAQSHDFSLPPPPDDLPNLTDLPKYLYLSVIASTLIFTIFLVLWTCYLFLLHVGRKRTLARRYEEYKDKTLQEKELEITTFRQRFAAEEEEEEEEARLHESPEGKEQKSEKQSTEKPKKSRIQYLLDRELKAEEKKKEKFSRGLRRKGPRNSYDERGKEEARIGQEKDE